LEKIFAIHIGSLENSKVKVIKADGKTFDAVEAEQKQIEIL